MAFRPPSGGGGLTNPMPLDTFLQGTRTDTTVVPLVGVTDDFGGGDLVVIGDYANDTSLVLARSDGFTTKSNFLQLGNLVQVQQIEDVTNSEEMIVDMDLQAAQFQYKVEKAAAMPLGTNHLYQSNSDLIANNDILHNFEYSGYNDSLFDVTYAGVQVVALDVTTGSEVGQYSIKARDLGGLYSPMVFTGAKRIDIALAAGATQYTALYNEASLTETFTDNSNNLTILTQDTARWNVSAQDIGLGYFGSAEVNADSILLSLDDGVGVEPKLSLDFNTPYFGLGSPFDFGMTIDITNNLINFDGNVVFNDELTTGASSLLGLFGASATGQLGPIADATGAGDVVAQLNALLAVCRTYGFIAT